MTITTAGTERRHRAAYAQGLRDLADAIEAHDEIPLPYDGTRTPIIIYFLDGDARAAMAATATAIPCSWRKTVTEEDDYRAYLYLDGELHGLKIRLCAYRDAVCERVVTGTREVVEKVKDPDALAAVPEITVTKTVEDVEWRCHPVLAPAADSREVGSAA